MPVPEVVDDALALEPDWLPDLPHARPPVPAAVLIALVERGDGFSILYTKRASDLRHHSGQVAFPGGKLEPEDCGPAEAALREAGEEVGLRPDDAEVLGYLPTYFTGTNYLITPVVAVVRPCTQFVPDPREVSDLFEVPLDLVSRPDSFSTYHVTRQGVTHSTWQILYRGHTIWGITGNLTRRFFEIALKAFPGEVVAGSPSGNASGQKAFPGEVVAGSPFGNASGQKAFPGEVVAGSPSGNASKHAREPLRDADETRHDPGEPAA